MKGSNLIKHIAAKAHHNPFSVYSNNCNELGNKYCTNFDLFTDRILYLWNNCINLIDVSNVNVLKEIIDIRDGGMICVTLSRENTLHIIDDICLNNLFYYLLSSTNFLHLLLFLNRILYYYITNFWTLCK